MCQIVSIVRDPRPHPSLRACVWSLFSSSTEVSPRLVTSAEILRLPRRKVCDPPLAAIAFAAQIDHLRTIGGVVVERL